MTNEFEQSALAYQKSSLEWQQRCNIAIAERDKLRDQWSDLLIEQARLMALRDEAVQQRDGAIAERDALRTEVQQSRLEFQIMQAHAKQDALAVQP